MTGSLKFILVTVNFKGEPIYNYSFPVRELTIGRSNDCDIILDNAGVSRQHAVLSCANDEIEVTDLDSGNGTFVNEETVQKAVLKSTDTLRISKFTLNIELSDKPGECSPVEPKGEADASSESTQTIFLSPEQRKQILEKAPVEPVQHAPSRPTNEALSNISFEDVPWKFVFIGAVAGFLLRSFFELF